MEDAFPHRGLASFQRELASPIDILASPLTRIQRFTLKPPQRLVVKEISYCDGDLFC